MKIKNPRMVLHLVGVGGIALGLGLVVSAFCLPGGGAAVACWLGGGQILATSAIGYAKALRMLREP